MLITTTIAYTYDPLYRLTSARYSDGRFLTRVIMMGQSSLEESGTLHCP